MKPETAATAINFAIVCAAVAMPLGGVVSGQAHPSMWGSIVLMLFSAEVRKGKCGG